MPAHQFKNIPHIRHFTTSTLSQAQQFELPEPTTLEATNTSYPSTDSLKVISPQQTETDKSKKTKSTKQVDKSSNSIRMKFTYDDFIVTELTNFQANENGMLASA